MYTHRGALPEVYLVGVSIELLEPGNGGIIDPSIACSLATASDFLNPTHSTHGQGLGPVIT